MNTPMWRKHPTLVPSLAALVAATFCLTSWAHAQNVEGKSMIAKFPGQQTDPFGARVIGLKESFETYSKTAQTNLQQIQAAQAEFKANPTAGTRAKLANAVSASMSAEDAALSGIVENAEPLLKEIESVTKQLGDTAKNYRSKSEAYSNEAGQHMRKAQELEDRLANFADTFGDDANSLNDLDPEISLAIQTVYDTLQQQEALGRAKSTEQRVAETDCADLKKAQDFLSKYSANLQIVIRRATLKRASIAQLAGMYEDAVRRRRALEGISEQAQSLRSTAEQFAKLESGAQAFLFDLGGGTPRLDLPELEPLSIGKILHDVKSRRNHMTGASDVSTSQTQRAQTVALHPSARKEPEQ